ncbi:hypothetical protein HPG69_016358 [Diceros bicornis minor]|uniref:AIG1-type G domain-containing protein n=1 Tax=Diceros bicornis minor TaxID=77932 RepID=A0A7J7ET37_DICBM|nr:hypothetical protein HPG69_016358 [Diceros bicornis minor]
MFGHRARRHMILLFTRKDELDGTDFHDYLEEAPECLQELMGEFGDRYCVFNNRATGAEQEAQRAQLLALVHHMLIRLPRSILNLNEAEVHLRYISLLMQLDGTYETPEPGQHPALFSYPVSLLMNHVNRSSPPERHPRLQSSPHQPSVLLPTMFKSFNCFLGRFPFFSASLHSTPLNSLLENPFTHPDTHPIHALSPPSREKGRGWRFLLDVAQFLHPGFLTEHFLRALSLDYLPFLHFFEQNVLLGVLVGLVAIVTAFIFPQDSFDFLHELLQLGLLLCPLCPVVEATVASPTHHIQLGKVLVVGLSHILLQGATIQVFLPSEHQDGVGQDVHSKDLLEAPDYLPILFCEPAQLCHQEHCVRPRGGEGNGSTDALSCHFWWGPRGQNVRGVNHLKLLPSPSSAPSLEGLGHRASTEFRLKHFPAKDAVSCCTFPTSGFPHQDEPQSLWGQVILPQT